MASRTSAGAGRIVLPPLPPPPTDSNRYDRHLPPSAQVSLPPPSAIAPSAYSQGAGPVPYAPNSSSTTFRQSAASSSFQSLPLPPPPVAMGLSTYASPSVPSKRIHRSRSGRDDELGGPRMGMGGQPGEWEREREEQKRRRTGGWDGDADSVSAALSIYVLVAQRNYDCTGLPSSKSSKPSIRPPFIATAISS